MTKPMEKEKNELKAKIKTELKTLAEKITVENQKSVLLESYKKALASLAKTAEEGDLDAIKLLNECIQDSQELKLRKELFGV